MDLYSYLIKGPTHEKLTISSCLTGLSVPRGSLLVPSVSYSRKLAIFLALYGSERTSWVFTRTLWVPIHEKLAIFLVPYGSLYGVLAYLVGLYTGIPYGSYSRFSWYLTGLSVPRGSLLVPYGSYSRKLEVFFVPYGS